MSVTLRGIFNRVDSNGDGAVTRNEVRSFVEAAGVGEGLFAGAKVSGATDAFMDAFDPQRTGRVTWDQFAARGAALIPGAAADSSPEAVRAAAENLVTGADTNRDGQLTRGEISSNVERALNEQGVGMASTKADIAARVAVHMLDGNGDGRVGRDEVRSLANDVARELARVRASGGR